LMMRLSKSSKLIATTQLQLLMSHQMHSLLKRKLSRLKLMFPKIKLPMKPPVKIRKQILNKMVILRMKQ